MNSVRTLGGLALITVLAGCAGLDPAVPPGYAGSTATIADSVQQRSSSVSNIYAVVEVDGRRIANSFRASTGASQGQGFKLTTQAVERQVPARPSKLKLQASPLTGAPIQQMAMQIAGTFYSVEGVVEFTPVAGSRYIVRGELKKDGSSVWIEDADSGQVVSEKLTRRP